MKTFVIEIREDEIKDIEGDLIREGADITDWNGAELITAAIPFDAKVRELKVCKTDNAIEGIMWALLITLVITMAGLGIYKWGEWKGYSNKVCGRAQCMEQIIKYSR